MSEEAGERPGCLMPIIWMILSGLITVGCLVALGMAVADSESAGVAMTNVVAFPQGFALSAGLAALVVHFAIPRKSLARVLVPPGCGCLGGVGFLGLAFVFFAILWPML